MTLSIAALARASACFFVAAVGECANSFFPEIVSTHSQTNVGAFDGPLKVVEKVGVGRRRFWQNSSNAPFGFPSAGAGCAGLVAEGRQGFM